MGLPPAIRVLDCRNRPVHFGKARLPPKDAGETPGYVHRDLETGSLS
jgi:hypothetical protein